MFKKILKIVGIVLLFLVILAFAIPYFFKDQIKAKILTVARFNRMLRTAKDAAEDIAELKKFSTDGKLP